MSHRNAGWNQTINVRWLHLLRCADLAQTPMDGHNSPIMMDMSNSPKVPIPLMPPALIFAPTIDDDPIMSASQGSGQHVYKSASQSVTGQPPNLSRSNASASVSLTGFPMTTPMPQLYGSPRNESHSPSGTMMVLPPGTILCVVGPGGELIQTAPPSGSVSITDPGFCQQQQVSSGTPASSWTTAQSPSASLTSASNPGHMPAIMMNANGTPQWQSSMGTPGSVTTFPSHLLPNQISVPMPDPNFQSSPVRSNAPPRPQMPPISTAAPVQPHVRRQATGRSLVVTGLPATYDFYQLKSLFQQFGSIRSTRVLTYPDTKRCKGVGYVNFDNGDDAATACQRMNGVHVDIHSNTVCKWTNAVRAEMGAPASGIINILGDDEPHAPAPDGNTFVLHVSPADEDLTYISEETTKIFVRHVPPWASAEDLGEVFRRRGYHVVSSIVRDDTSSKGLSEGTQMKMGYVTFQTVEEAVRASTDGSARDGTPASLFYMPGSSTPLAVKLAETLACRNQRQSRAAAASALATLNHSAVNHKPNNIPGAAHAPGLYSQPVSGPPGYAPPVFSNQAVYNPGQFAQAVPAPTMPQHQHPVMPPGMWQHQQSQPSGDVYMMQNSKMPIQPMLNNQQQQQMVFLVGNQGQGLPQSYFGPSTSVVSGR